MRISDWSSDVCSSDLGARPIFIAADEAAMRTLPDAAGYFAPELNIIQFPAWDCLPYDRSSPSLRSSSERLAALSALQAKPTGPELVVTTLAAVTQLTLTPFRIRQLTARLAPGERIDSDRLALMLAANGSRSEEQNSELQPLMRSAYDIFC